MYLEDLLSPLEAEQVKSMFDPKETRIRGLVSSFFKMTIPLEATSNRTKVKALLIKPLTSNSDKIIVGLLWHVCFGQKFKVYHWYILFAVLIRTMIKGGQSRNLLKVLIISTSSEGKMWQSSLKSVKTVLSNVYGKETAQKKIAEILELFPFVLPLKAPKIESLIEVKVGYFIQKKPKEPVRIGVGYKDHGSLGGDTLEPVPPDFFREQSDVFDILLRQVKKEIPEFF
jgi:hypothetical protein